MIQDPAGEAYKLRLAGISPSEIAASGLGYSSGPDVGKAIKERLKREARLVGSEDRDSLLALEIDRLDALQAAVWQEAMSGEPKAVDSALKVVIARAKLLGLDLPDATSVGTTVLVVHGDEDSYVKGLKTGSRHGHENSP